MHFAKFFPLFALGLININCFASPRLMEGTCSLSSSYGATDFPILPTNRKTQDGSLLIGEASEANFYGQQGTYFVSVLVTKDHATGVQSLNLSYSAEGFTPSFSTPIVAQGITSITGVETIRSKTVNLPGRVPKKLRCLVMALP